MGKTLPAVSFRRVDPVAAAAFVELDDKPPTDAPHAAPSGRWKRKVLRRADGRELRKQTFYLDAELSHRFTIACAQAQLDMSAAIEDAVDAWVRARQ